MKLRYTLLVGLFGLAVIYVFHSSIDAILILVGCWVLYALRRIEHQVGDVKAAHAASDPIGPDDEWLTLRNGSTMKFADAFHPYKPYLTREISLHEERQVETVVVRLKAAG